MMKELHKHDARIDNYYVYALVGIIDNFEY